MDAKPNPEQLADATAALAPNESKPDHSCEHLWLRRAGGKLLVELGNPAI
jgi:hypothetical protein